jgi:3-dehydroquinate synthase
LNFTFGEYKTHVNISRDLPCFEKISEDLQENGIRPLVIIDENTKQIAESIFSGHDVHYCQLKSGEENKNWQAVETILASAHKAGLGRDGVFIGVGGGIIGDLTGFAASIYMRGCRFVLIATTLLAMVDASIGGKTGFDLFGIKNFAGSFYPAEIVYMPLKSLDSLSKREWKSGFAELIKTAVLDGDDFLDMLAETSGRGESCVNGTQFVNDVLLECIQRAVLYKGDVVSEDFREGGKRKLLNLGHTFGHALEAAAGLGNISHGEAVAWGIVQSCALGIELGITPRPRAEKITALIASSGYDCSYNPLASSTTFLESMLSDKKKKDGKMTLIVPDEKSARVVTLEDMKIVERILSLSDKRENEKR